MDLWKFVSMLVNTGLWMSRIDVLRADDPYEGTIPRWVVDEWNAAHKSCDAMLNGRALDPAEKGKLWQEFKPSQALERYVTRLYANCWNLGEVESNALWRIYCGNGAGVAIKSTYSRLTACIPSRFRIGLVEYCFHDGAKFRMNAFAPAMLKRDAFQYESEVRVIESFVDVSPEEWPLDHGHFANVDLNYLIQEVRISPYAPVGFSNAVRAIIDRFGYSLITNNSAMSTPPSGEQ